jgi:hypothetical protein
MNAPANVGLWPPKDEGLAPPHRLTARCLVVDEGAMKGGNLCSPIYSSRGVESTEGGAVLDESVDVDLFA